MIRVLYCHTIRRPASGYVQGMNDLSAPFFDAFLREYSVSEAKIKVSLSEFRQVEADVFWCLGKLLDTVQDVFTFNQAGLYRQIATLKEIVQRADNSLFLHLERIGVDFSQFSFRWFNCLMLREFPLCFAERIWDTYLAEGELGFSEFHLYVCAAFLSRLSSTLQTMEFQV
jgi:TBC1 domain family member 2